MPASSLSPTLLMVCSRNYTLRTTKGHTIEFRANIPTPVPDICVEDALAVNVLPVNLNGDALPAHRDSAATGFSKIKAMPQALREAIVLRVIDELVRENAKESFSGGGRPKVAVVRDRVAVDVSQQELDKAWNRYRELKSTNEDLPTHRNLDLVYDIQQTSSPKSLHEYATQLDLSPAEITGLSIAELKSALVAHAVIYDSDAARAFVNPGKLDEPVE